MNAALNAALRTLEKFYPAQLRLNNETVPCTASTEARGSTFAPGGTQLEITLTVFLRAETLSARSTADLFLITADSDSLTGDEAAAPPRSGLRVWVNERGYRVATARLDPANAGGATPDKGAIWRLELMDVNR